MIPVCLPLSSVFARELSYIGILCLSHHCMLSVCEENNLFNSHSDQKELHLSYVKKKKYIHI